MSIPKNASQSKKVKKKLKQLEERRDALTKKIEALKTISMDPDLQDLFQNNVTPSVKSSDVKDLTSAEFIIRILEKAGGTMHRKQIHKAFADQKPDISSTSIDPILSRLKKQGKVETTKEGSGVYSLTVNTNLPLKIDTDNPPPKTELVYTFLKKKHPESMSIGEIKKQVERYYPDIDRRTITDTLYNMRRTEKYSDVKLLGDGEYGLEE